MQEIGLTVCSPTLAMYSVTMNRLPFSSTITPSSCTRFSCRSCLNEHTLFGFYTLLVYLRLFKKTQKKKLTS